MQKYKRLTGVLGSVYGYGIGRTHENKKSCKTDPMSDGADMSEIYDTIVKKNTDKILGFDLFYEFCESGCAGIHKLLREICVEFVKINGLSEDSLEPIYDTVVKRLDPLGIIRPINGSPSFQKILIYEDNLPIVTVNGEIRTLTGVTGEDVHMLARRISNGCKRVLNSEHPKITYEFGGYSATIAIPPAIPTWGLAVKKL